MTLIVSIKQMYFKRRTVTLTLKADKQTHTVKSWKVKHAF